MSGWQTALLIMIPVTFVIAMGVFAWAASTGRDKRWGAKWSSRLERHPVLWGVMYGGVWLVPAAIWGFRGHVGLAAIHVLTAVGVGAAGWRAVARLSSSAGEGVGQAR